MNEASENYKNKLKWFKDRIGKRVFRDKNTCDCETCKEVFENGLIVADEDHAYYLTDVSCELQINYSDEKNTKQLYK